MHHPDPKEGKVFVKSIAVYNEWGTSDKAINLFLVGR
jgi:hypothetical protein